MNTKWVVGIIIAVIALGGGYALSRQQVQNKMEAEKESDSMAGDPNNSMELKGNKVTKDAAALTAESGTMMDEQTTKTGEGSMQEPSIMQKPGAYKDYSQEALATATRDGGKAVLFFWASWCPYCKVANEDFTNNAGQIPAGVTILKTNYDTEKKLKTKYGITYQHTFVQVDASGTQITKWSGGGVKELKINIK